MNATKHENMMRAKNAAAYLGISRSTLWRWHEEGKLPRGIRLSKRCTVWRKEDLDEFIARAEGDFQTRNLTAEIEGFSL